MSRCARGRRVFFIEEPIIDGADPRIELSHVQDQLYVVVPHLPTVSESEHAHRRLLDDLVALARIRDPILWFYTPMAIAHAPHVAPRAIVYDCMDELSNFRGAPAMLRDRERELFERADLVFTGGRSLYEAKRSRHPHVYEFPSSVDFQHFAKARSPGIEPVDQRAIPHPRLGFFGVVDERMDLDLLEAVADMRPDLHFVIIGPVVKIDPLTLPIRPNIHWLGKKRYDELPSYIAHWDVAIMPFARNDATRFISPTKTLEYLAAGKPVVSTSIHDVVHPYGEEGFVRIADSPSEFTAAASAALAPNDPRAGDREAMLARTSWDDTWARMNALLDGVVKGSACSTI
jgi:UDP-galactopyranose mutase